MGFRDVGLPSMKEVSALAVQRTKKFSMRVLNSQGCAIAGRCHTHNAPEDLGELTLVGEAATHSSLKNRNAGLLKQLPGVLNPSP